MWKGSEGNQDDGEAMAQTSPNGGKDEVIAFVGKGVEVKGVLSYKGTVRIDGYLEGEIRTEGVLLVGEEAVIKAQVSAGTVISQGKMTGDITAIQKVNLMAPAVLNGSVKAPLLAMEEGVLFTGQLEMTKAEPVESAEGRNKPVTPIRITSSIKAG